MGGKPRSKVSRLGCQPGGGQCSDPTCVRCGEPDERTFAFWRYDLFPYMLGGAVAEVRNGLVYIPSYQSWFNPIRIVDLVKGQKLHGQLMALRAERELVIDNIKKDYEARAEDIFGEPLNNRR